MRSADDRTTLAAMDEHPYAWAKAQGPIRMREIVDSWCARGWASRDGVAIPPPVSRSSADAASAKHIRDEVSPLIHRLQPAEVRLVGKSDALLVWQGGWIETAVSPGSYNVEFTFARPQVSVMRIQLTKPAALRGRRAMP